MTKMKLGELAIDRRTWVRNKESLDHVRCMVNDLANGATFPPLKVDKNTKTIVGGNHRYAAYRLHYGKDWETKSVAVEMLNLPPFEENPQAWYLIALEDNRHLAERLGYGDRNGVITSLLKAQDDPRSWADSPEAQRIRELVHKTPQGWLEFIELVLGSREKSPAPAGREAAASAAQGEPVQDEGREGHVQPVIQAQKHVKYSTDDIQPQDVKGLSSSFNSQVLSKAYALIAILKDNDERYLSNRSREALANLAQALAGLLEVKSA